MRRIDLSDPIIQKIAKKYEDGHSITKIATEFNISRDFVWLRLAAAKIKMRPPVRQYGKPVKYKQEQIDCCIEMYAKGVSSKEIRAITGLPGHAVKKYTRFYGLLPQAAGPKPKHPDWSESRRAWNANLRKYGMTVDKYEEMLKIQNNVCAICGNSPKESARLAVDHDHLSGKVRGLIHRKCNSAIGLLNDDPALLRAAADYLEKSNSR